MGVFLVQLFPSTHCGVTAQQSTSIRGVELTRIDRRFTMQLWKQTASSIILALNAFNSLIRALANFLGMFEQASELSALEQEIEDRQAIKDMATKYSMTAEDLEAIRAKRKATA